MPDRTPAETLLAAADRLKALREAATPGPWNADGTEIYGDATLPLNWVGETLQLDNDEGGAANAAYIAAMSPVVGEALEALFRHEVLFMPPDVTNYPAWQPEIDLARAILGEDRA